MAERLYNVVIEQPRSPAPGAAAALAAAISARYGIPAADLERRISRGRFKVKSRVDRTTADTYATDLNRLGAVCVVQAADDGPAAFSGPIDVPSGTQPAVRRETGPPPGTDPSRPRLSPETLQPAPATDPGRPRFAPDTLQPSTDPGLPRVAAPAHPGTEPGRQRVPVEAVAPRPTTEQGRQRMSAEAVAPRPTTEPGRQRVPAEAMHPTHLPTDPSRPRVAPEAVRPATEPSRPRVSAEAVRPATDPSRPRVAPAAVRPATEPSRAVAPASAPTDLGALTGGFPLTLSTLDGAAPEGGPAVRANSSNNLPASFGPATNPPASFGPATNLPASFGPATNLPASFGPPTTPEAPTPPPSGSGSRLPRAESQAVAAPEPVVDRFAPPPAAAVDVEVALDTDMPRRREPPGAPPAAGARVQEVPWPAATLPPRISESRPGATMAGGPTVATTGRPGSGLRDPRVRLVLGAVLAVGLGFVPAHLVASMREKTAYAEIDADLAHRQTMIHTPEEVDAVRAAHAARKRAARQNIALGSLALWALVGGGVAWLWFRRIDWDHVLGPSR